MTENTHVEAEGRRAQPQRSGASATAVAPGLAGSARLSGDGVDLPTDRLGSGLEAEATTQGLPWGQEPLAVRLADTLNARSLGIALIRDGNVVSMNPACRALLGLGEGECGAMPVQKLFANGVEGERSEIAASAMTRLLETSADGVWLKRKGGEDFLCQVSVWVVDESDTGGASVWLLEDLTGACRAEGPARLQSEMLAHLGAGVMLVSESDGAILVTNPAFDGMLGYGEGELRGKPISIVTAPGALSREEMARKIEGGIHENGCWEGEVAIQRKDGTSILCHASVSRFRNSELGNVWVSVHTDITEQRTLENVRRESQKMTAIGHLAGGMAHEFNNILAAMLLNIGLAQGAGGPPGVTEILEDLQKSCLRAGQLIKQLLAFSRRSILRPQRIELNAFLCRQIPLLQRLLGDGVRVEWSGATHPMLAMADLALLEQALRNLAENARDAMTGSGVVRIELEAKDVETNGSRTHPEASAGSFACLSVTDEGCGMDRMVRERLFEPFFTTKEVGQGTGLGLATVQGIIQQHRGWVEVETDVGRGSRFRVYLPLSERCDTPSGDELAAVPPANTPATILLAEDDPRLRKVVSLLLRRAGYRVLAAPDAAAAWELWEANGRGIDLLLTDVIMPGPDSGIQLAQRLLSERPGLKVIVTSGCIAGVEEHAAAIREQMVYLAKPVAAEVLLNTIRQSLASGR